jgi:hypothetical protein
MKKLHMKALTTKILLTFGAFLVFSGLRAQEDWPKNLSASDGSSIKVYQPQPESFTGNLLKFRAAISVTNGTAEPIFGTFWANAKVETDRDSRVMNIGSLEVSNLKIPAETDQGRLDMIKSAIESQASQSIGQIPLDEVLASLDQNEEQVKLSNNISTQAPKVIFTTSPSILVLIDGQPKLQPNNDWGVDVVVNSPFTIVRNTDGRFYLYGSQRWYVAPSATGTYSFTNGNYPQNLNNIASALNSSASNNTGNNAAGSNNAGNNGAAPPQADESVVPEIVVATSPTELIQSKGEPNFTPIEGTSLLYMKNSDNDIFMDVNSQLYYVLISGRWYRSKGINSNQWDYIAANQLPGDFAKIPEGSPKDNVLASVAGTDAANEAVMDAQIPQTAKVDRHTATTTVTYNGDPQFSPINGTKMQYAVNTSSTVIRYKGKYYAVDNGVWFISESPTGPWVVSTERPDEIESIPPDNPDYNAKYVDVYDVTPDYVYMGYTPGYLNSYVFGPTVVYGTGFYYDPWWGPYYFPRPWSWGFNFGYNPWYGWSFGLGYSVGWFNVGFGYHWGGWGGGWWGPSVYHPAYWGYRGAYRPYSFYGRNVVINRNTYINVNNNIYRNRGGVVTRNNSRFVSGNNRTFAGRNNTGPANNNRAFNPNGSGAASPQRNNVFADRQGNVYQRASPGQWQQRDNRQWKPVTNTAPVVRNLNQQQQMRDRGQVRAQNFERARPSNFGGGSSRPAPAAAPSRSSSGNGGGGGRSGGRR